MLALLDDVPGVAQTRVDWTGRRFLLELDAHARADEILPRARILLGGDVRRLEPSEEIAAVAGYRRGEQWMLAGETVALSQAEARVLAQRHGTEAAREIGLDAQQTARLIAVIEGEVRTAFEGIHAAGQGLPADQEALFTGVAVRALAKARAFLTQEQVERFEAYVARRPWGR